MKKTLMVVLVGVLALSCIGCSQTAVPAMSDSEILAAAEELLSNQGKVIITEDEYSFLLAQEEDEPETVAEPATEQTLEPTPEPTTETTIGERTSPAGIGDIVTVTTRDSLVEIELLEVIRGDEALQIAIAANQFNEVEDGKEIIMAKFRITNMEDLSGEDETYFASDIQFDYSDSSYAVDYSMASVAGLDEELHAELYEGATVEGYVCFEANEGEVSPYAVFEDTAWFDISGDNSLTASSDASSSES